MGVIIAIMVTMAIAFGIACAESFVLWVVWPYAISAFPGVVEHGYAVSDISFTTAIGLVIVFNILIKTNATRNSKDK